MKITEVGLFSPPEHALHHARSQTHNTRTLRLGHKRNQTAPDTRHDPAGTRWTHASYIDPHLHVSSSPTPAPSLLSLELLPPRSSPERAASLEPGSRRPSLFPISSPEHRRFPVAAANSARRRRRPSFRAHRPAPLPLPHLTQICMQAKGKNLERSSPLVYTRSWLWIGVIIIIQ